MVFLGMISLNRIIDSQNSPDTDLQRRRKKNLTQQVCDYDNAPGISFPGAPSSSSAFSILSTEAILSLCGCTLSVLRNPIAHG